MCNKWPLAYTLLEKINFDKQMIGEMALYRYKPNGNT